MAYVREIIHYAIQADVLSYITNHKNIHWRKIIIACNKSQKDVARNRNFTTVKICIEKIHDQSSKKILYGLKIWKTSYLAMIFCFKIHAYENKSFEYWRYILGHRNILMSVNTIIASIRTGEISFRVYYFSICVHWRVLCLCVCSTHLAGGVCKTECIYFKQTVW